MYHRGRTGTGDSGVAFMAIIAVQAVTVVDDTQSDLWTWSRANCQVANSTDRLKSKDGPDELTFVLASQHKNFLY